MRSWDINPWCNFCDPHWELICHNKWHPGTSKISTPPKIAVGTHFHPQMALKLSQYLYLLMERPLGRYFQVQSPYYQAAQCNQKTPIPESTRWQVRSVKAKKGSESTLITGTTSVHLPKVVSTGLTKSDLVLTNPIGKDGVWGWSMQHNIPHNIFLLWYHH